MKKNYLLFIFGFLCALGYSQSGESVVQDSLQKLYEKIKVAIGDYEYVNSIQLSRDLIDLAEENKNETYLYHGYNLLGTIYANLGDTARTEDYYIKALEHAKASRNDTILWWAYNNMGNVYSQNKETLNKGFLYYDKAIAIINRIGAPNAIDPVLNKGWTHLDYNQFDKAYPYLLKASELMPADAGNNLQSTLQALYGQYYTGKEDYERARCFFETAIFLAEDDSLILKATYAYKKYSEMLFKSGAYEEAYKALETHISYQDRIYEKEKRRQTEAASARFEIAEYRKDLEIAKKEQEYQNEMLGKTKQISIILVCSFSVLLLFFVMIYKNNQIRKHLIMRLRDKNYELGRSKEEAERLSLLKTRFFSTVSHELRTPLYGVVGLTSLLLEENKNKKQEEDLKSLKFSADYLLALINDVLQMNKMESKLMHLENVPFNIENVMQGIVKSFEFSRHQNGNEISLHIDENIPENLIGDSVRLSQILMNLVGNALKFTERGKVWIKANCKKCEHQKCSIYFEVGDTGIGIPKDKQREIFEEFSQLRSANYNYQGTGLGLPIVKKLLHLFNSEIKVESENEKGTVFSFEITFEEGKTNVSEAPLDKNSVKTLVDANELVGKKALIVDDNRINQIITQRILEKRDFKCAVAGSGEEALAKLKQQQFDVVLMDVNMPGMNGMETTKKIREFNTRVPVIALTAVEIDEMREAILASGMNDIIVKPYDVMQFVNTILRNLLVPVKDSDDIVEAS